MVWMDKLGAFIFKNRKTDIAALQHIFVKLWRECLAAGLSLSGIEKLEDVGLDISQCVDDFSNSGQYHGLADSAYIRDQQFKAWAPHFENLFVEFKDGLQNAKIHKCNFEVWLKKLHRYKSLLFILLHITGPASRMTEIRQVKLSNVDGRVRSLFAMEEWLLILGQYSKQNQLTGRELSTVRYLAPCVARLVMLYLVRMRPIENFYIRHYHKGEKDVDYHCYLFQSKGVRWEPSAMSAMLKANVGFMASEWRQVHQAIHDEFNLDPPSFTRERIGTTSSGHSENTVAHHYGRTSKEHPLFSRTDRLKAHAYQKKLNRFFGFDTSEPQELTVEEMVDRAREAELNDAQARPCCTCLEQLQSLRLEWKDISDALKRTRVEPLPGPVAIIPASATAGGARNFGGQHSSDPPPPPLLPPETNTSGERTRPDSLSQRATRSKTRGQIGESGESAVTQRQAFAPITVQINAANNAGVATRSAPMSPTATRTHSDRSGTGQVVNLNSKRDREQVVSSIISRLLSVSLTVIFRKKVMAVDPL